LLGSAGYRSGSINERSLDLNGFLRDPTIDLIICSTGGFNSNELLESVDLRAAKESKACLVGYSDVTALTLGLRTISGMQTVHGPMLVDIDQDPNCFVRLFEALREKQDVTLPDEVWDSKDRRRTYPGLRALSKKLPRCSGTIVAGNLSTFNLLLGTPYQPSVDGVVLFLEYDLEERNAFPSLQRLLWQVRQAGMFKDINGLVFGILQEAVAKEETSDWDLSSLLAEVTDSFDFPVLFDAPFGHVHPSWILPNGLEVQLKTDGGRPSVSMAGS
jgi:muramoyltetrapeptide carboxypeptidase LdcA involved in peptidoglycan recycling